MQELHRQKSAGTEKFMRSEAGSDAQVDRRSSVPHAHVNDYNNWNEFEDSTWIGPRVLPGGQIEVVGPNVSYNATPGDADHLPEPIPSHGQVPIHVFYESRCPYSLDFLSKTLFPLWNDTELRDYVDIHLYPYGNAIAIPNVNVSEGYKFWHHEAVAYPYIHICQHGVDECLGNTIQACMLKHLPKDTALAIIFCMAAEQTWSVEKSSFECMKEHEIAPEQVQSCVQGWEGNDLLTTMGEHTENSSVTMTPTIFIHTAAANRTTFAQDVCQAIANMTDQWPLDEGLNEGLNGSIPTVCANYVSNVHDKSIPWNGHLKVQHPSSTSVARIYVPVGASFADSRQCATYAECEVGPMAPMLTVADKLLPAEDAELPSDA